MALSLSVVICTHNPQLENFRKTLAALEAQDLDRAEWELVIVDNASTEPVAARFEAMWHPSVRIIEESRLGLSNARLCGFAASRGETLVFVDDDNILAPSYLSAAQSAMSNDLLLGAIGGKSIPDYEISPPSWIPEFTGALACRDLGERPLYAAWNQTEGPDTRSYPACAPIGAGLVIRRSALSQYVEQAAGDAARMRLGRAGKDLSSGEDNDIIMTLLENGWKVAYLPELVLRHLIPAVRLSRSYLSRLAYSSMRTWIAVLDMHGVRPWHGIAPWTVPLRKGRAFLTHRAWAGAACYISWRGACGQFDARAKLRDAA